MNLHCLNPFRSFRRPGPGDQAATKTDLETAHKDILMKLSELAGSLAALNSQVTTIGSNVAAIKANQTDPVLPADAAANLTTLQGNVDTVVTASNPS